MNAYDRQLADILGTVDERFSEMQEALDTGMARIEAAGETAVLAERNAKQAENAAAARVAYARMISALDSGIGFAAELGILREMGELEPPPSLASAADDGVPTLGELTDAFPEVAREALDAATLEAVDSGDIGPLRAFLRTQLGLRSLEPREGESPDAVLSRAEAAARADDLDTALTEIAALPEAGRARFADWIALAELRRDALDAAAALAAQLGN